MLKPQDRQILLEALRPPEGYSLDYAIGTTYSLDLLAILTAPLAFTFFDWEDDAGRHDPSAILAALRRYASRISIFSHAGNIYVPRQYEQPLYAYLEEAIVQVLPPQEGGAFHPKVWILRYIASDKPVAYRVLCLSRNLTHDRSWDTALVLDGVLMDSDDVVSANHPLGDFVAALPTMALRGVPERIQGMIDLMQEEIRRVVFQPPEGFEEIEFHPLGLDHGRPSWPFPDEVDGLLAVSPFISRKCLSRLVSMGRNSILVSRLEELQKIPPSYLRMFSEVYYLNQYAMPEKVEDAISEIGTIEGLHAKFYVADIGKDSYIWTGSANATGHAFEKNVEFLVRLKGRRANCGIAALMDSKMHQLIFRDLLERYNIHDIEISEDPLEKALERAIDVAKDAIVRSDMSVHIVPVDDQGYRMILESSVLSFPEGISVCCWPITLPDRYACQLTTGSQQIAVFQGISDLKLTPFFAFEMTALIDGRTGSSRFVLILPLEGGPDDRQERMLSSIYNKELLIRLLFHMLFFEGDPHIDGFLQPLDGTTSDGKPQEANYRALPLFESMVRALARDPERLDDVKRLIDDLSNHQETCDLLPEGFERIWKPIWAARIKVSHDDTT